MRSLFAAALLLCCARQVVGDGCAAPGFSMAPVFWRPEGSFFASGDCSGEAKATCAFSGDYSIPGGVGSATITCPAGTPGIFTLTFTIQDLGVQASASGKSGECVGVPGYSANITCKPGLLLVLIPALLVLGCVGLCACCCCGCCGCGRRGGAGAASSQAQYMVLAPAAPAEAGFYASAPKPQQGRGYYLPPGAQ